jgi:hypothetical protein
VTVTAVVNGERGGGDRRRKMLLPSSLFGLINQIVK